MYSSSYGGVNNGDDTLGEQEQLSSLWSKNGIHASFAIHTVFPFASTEARVEILDNMIKRIRENQLESHTKNNNDARVHQ